MARNDAVITADRYAEARKQSSDTWTDFEVFEEERDKAPLREIVLEVVEGQYTHPAGPDSVYGMEGSAEDLVWDKVFHDSLVPDELPDEVKEQFARDLGDEVREHSSTLFKEVRDEIDPESDASLDSVRSVLESRAEEMVPEGY